jgi:hypothetical protein
MALVKCRDCDYETRVGCMPTATCGVLMLFGLSAGAGLAGILAARLLSTYSLWIRIPGAVVGFIIGGIAGVYGVHFVPWTVEWLMAMCRRCPECGKRKWSYPFTRGFGL